MVLDSWKHRRRLTYIAFFSILGLTAIVFIAAPWLAPETLNALSAFYSAFMFGMGGVIASYFGFATWDDRGKRDKPTHRIEPGPEQIG